MEDPNKAALDRIRLAIPRYRPGSGNNNILNSNNYYNNNNNNSIGTQANTNPKKITVINNSNNSNNIKQVDSSIGTHEPDGM